MMKAILFIVSSLLFLEVRAQEITPLLSRVKENYESKSEYSMQVTYNYYKDHESNVIQETLNGHYYQQGKNWRMDLPSLIMVGDEKLLIHADESLKQLFVVKGDKTATRVPMIDPATFAEKAKSMKILSETAQTVLYRYLPTETTSSIAFCDFEIDKQKQIITRAILYYRSVTSLETGEYVTRSPKVEIIFSSFQEKLLIPADRLTPGFFVIEQNQSFIKQPAYSDYHSSKK